jgi:hypothetical protein
MALPKQSAPKYTCVLPSDGKEIEFRPFLVKEQKVLMLAQQEENEKAMFRAVQDLIEACTFNKIKAKLLSTIDMEYLFLKIRVKSVGETTTVNLTCHNPDCDGHGECTIDLDNVGVVGDTPNNKIMINDEIGVELKYPTVAIVEQLQGMDEATSSIEMLKLCMVNIFDSTEIYSVNDSPTAELEEFVDNLSVQQLEDLAEFFNSIPRLEKDVDTECGTCGKEISKKITGIQGFF